MLQVVFPLIFFAFWCRCHTFCQLRPHDEFHPVATAEYHVQANILKSRIHESRWNRHICPIILLKKDYYKVTKVVCLYWFLFTGLMTPKGMLGTDKKPARLNLLVPSRKKISSSAKSMHSAFIIWSKYCSLSSLQARRCESRQTSCEIDRKEEK